MGQNCQYLAKNAIFGPNLAVLGPKILIFLGISKSFGAHITEKPPGHQKMTRNDNGPGPGRIYGETTVFTFGRKVFFFAKNPFFSKKNTKTIIYLGKGYCFVFTTFPGCGLNMARIKSELFLGQKTGFRPKIRFLPWDPFVNGPFVALGFFISELLPFL